MAWSLCTTSTRSTIAARLILAAIALVAAVQIAYFEIYFNSVTSLTEDLNISFFSNGNGSRNKTQNPTTKEDIRLIHQHNIQGKQIENRNSTGGQVHSRSRASSFPWDRDNTCYVVENICNIRKSQWLYFTDDTTSSKPKQPPKLSMLERFGPYISPNWPKEAESQLHRKKCTISNITNHLVVTGKHIRMMGEYYQRIMLPLHHLMQDYMSYSNATTSEKEVQYYIHFSDPNQKILDSHYLYTMGLPNGGRKEVHWLETLKHWVETVSNVKSCQCYRRLVFCGYTDNAPSNEKNTTMSLAPYHGIADNFEKHCNAEYGKRAKDLELENCTVWQDLRMSLLRMYEITHPDLLQNVHAYRKMLIVRALTSFDIKPTIIEQDWKVIGISQRSDRRKWLNINDTISHCNIKYHVLKIACVEVDVSDLPTKFTSTRTNRSLTSIEEQLVLYRSIDALIGIHGSQLTQGVLMKSNSVVADLLPWVPPITHWNYPVHGDGWVNQKNHPTPMGIMWHNTDITQAGYSLPRESVPLCQNKSDYEMHNFSGEELPNYYHLKGGANITELEYCLQVLHEKEFKWADRDFNVGLEMIDAFVSTFYFPTIQNSSIMASSDLEFLCDTWRERGEKNGFVLYNLWCREDKERNPSAHHYYQHS